MAIFSGTGTVHKVAEILKDDKKTLWLVLAVCYQQRSENSEGRWIEITARGQMADRVKSVKLGETIEFHLADMNVELILKDNQPIPKLTGYAVSLKVIK